MGLSLQRISSCCPATAGVVATIVATVILGVFDVALVVRGHLLHDIAIAVVASDVDGGACQLVLDVGRGVKITLRLVMSELDTSLTSATLVARTPNRMVPNPGTATECPSVAHALITSPIAAHAALMVP